ncbi:putative polyketide synthase [Tieghemostelium lacteum]|uniref:Putative polyketide synthase n=1 Tax=Tieghemostelium lacteum TaxID=361077 RepID=A0A152A845_TIELA|nr:putative polyketide synthase [Tieghemostelium lacteum]|eukprot:KYR02410.1 putative polyketide synthase [Tieghemostelium lacteum]
MVEGKNNYKCVNIYSLANATSDVKNMSFELFDDREFTSLVKNALPWMVQYPIILKLGLRKILLNTLGMESRYLTFNAVDRFKKLIRREIIPNIEDCNQSVIEPALKMSLKTSRKAIEDWGGNPKDITHIIFITNSTFEDLSLELMKQLGLRDDVERCPMLFQSFHSGLTGLRLAEQFARLNPNNRILLVMTDMLMNHAQFEDQEHMNRNNVGIHFYFSDGFTSLVIGSNEKKLDGESKGLVEVLPGKTTIIPDSTDYLGLKLHHNSISINATESLKDKVPPNLLPFARKLVDGCPVFLPSTDVYNFEYILHPGLPVVYEANSKQSKNDLRFTITAYKKFGHASVSSVFFVLEESLNPNAVWKHEYGFLMSFGVGLTTEGSIIRKI